MNKMFLCLFLAFFARANATSIIFPTFSQPVVTGDAVVVLSPDRLKLIALTLDGKTLWEQRLEERGTLFMDRSGRVLVSFGSSVRFADPTSGNLEPYFDPDIAVSDLGYSEEGDLFVGKKQDGKVPTLVFFDARSKSCIVTQPQGETLAYADDDFIVIANGERKQVEGGYSFTKGWLEAFDRRTGAHLWSVPFVRQPDPWHDSTRVGKYLVCDDGRDLVMIDLVSFLVIRKQTPKPANTECFTGLAADGDALLYVTSEMNFKDFNRSRHTIHKVTVPGLSALESHVVEIIEVARVQAAGEYYITDALYRTGCFRRDGTKVWEHFQMHRTGPIGGKIFFSDTEGSGLARIGSIELSTGKEVIFLSEKIESLEQ